LIDQTDKHLREWVATIEDNVTVSLEAPRDLTDSEADKDLRVIWLYLIDLAEMTPHHESKKSNWRIFLRYLVTVSATPPEEAHRILGKLLLATLESSEFEVEPEPIPVSLWSAFGIKPRPAFMLRVALNTKKVDRERKSKPVLNLVANTPK
jgi:hypothetical protein